MNRLSGINEGQSGPLGVLTVAEVMSSEPVTFSPRTSIDEAARTLCDRRIGGAAVVDDGRIVGVVSKSDLLERKAAVGSARVERVERVMTPICFAVRPSDAVMTAVRLMLYENVHRAIVVDEGRLIGMVTSFDIMRALVRRDDRSVAERLDESWHAEPAEAVYVDLRERTGT
jgi:CBS domain-containing protein